MTFDEYVAKWDALCAHREALESQLAPIKAKELEMRKAIVKSLSEAAGETLKEGVNRFPCGNGMTLKFTHKIDRMIDAAEIASARNAYSELNSADRPFDSLLRVKYELAKREFDKLDESAKRAVSRMIVSKPATPTLEVE